MEPRGKGGWANLVGIKEEADEGRREWTVMDRGRRIQ